MKKIVFLLALFVCCSLGYAQTSPPNALKVFLIGNIDSQQNILGLSTVEYLVVNNSDVSIKISKRDRWGFTAKINGRSIDFSQLEVTNLDDYDTDILPRDALHLVANLNLFDLGYKYKRITGLDIISPTKITIQASLRCNGIAKDHICYSEGIPITVHPLEKMEQDAFNYIQSIGYNPYKLTARYVLATFGVDTEIANGIISKYPKSTFAELASLSLAYQARDPENKAKVQHLLEKPLQSKYSFVRYLAEELLKKQ